MATATAQSIWPQPFASGPVSYLACWIGVALISSVLIGAEMCARSRRHHGGLADAMVWNAIEQFLPACIAGVTLSCVFLKFAPDSRWMLPGLWQLLVALGLFASVRSLPRAINLVGTWYFISGISVLIIASHSQSLTPWLMGAPFGIGQFFMAAVLYFASEEVP